MKTNLIIVLAVTAMAIQATAQPRVVSFVLNQDNQTNSVDIADFEHAKVLTAFDMCGTSAYLIGSEMDVVKGNVPFRFFLTKVGNPSGSDMMGTLAGLTVAGPATISVYTTVAPGGHRNTDQPVLVTLEICPSAYPVTNSAVIGPGQGAEINLESSTNLVQWTPATNGVYTAEAAMFFRMHLRRIQ